MRANLKNAKIGKRTTHIVLEHNDTDTDYFTKDEVTSILLLIGGYNQFGRDVDLQVYTDLKLRFQAVLDDMTSEYREAKRNKNK